MEKSTARQWIVNYVADERARPELLRLMATWWGFSEEDRIRVGLQLSEGELTVPFSRPPADGDGASLLGAFEAFLIEESGEG